MSILLDGLYKFALVYTSLGGAQDDNEGKRQSKKLEQTSFK
jgi:hypothetical protein